MSTPSRNEKTAHLVWCALIALLTARQDGRVQTEQQENIFLIRWLADAERQRRFSRDVATDISWLLKQGRTLGLHARLRQKLDYIWRSSTGDIMEQTDLFRLTWGLETAKNEFWLYQLLSDPEWRKQNTAQINPGVNAIFILNIMPAQSPDIQAGSSGC